MHRLIVVLSFVLSLSMYSHVSAITEIHTLVDDQDRTTLHLAVLVGDTRKLSSGIAYFTERYMSVNPLDYNRKTPFDYAQQYHKNNPQLQMKLQGMLRNAGGVCGYDIED